MFGFSLSKLLVLAAVILVVWYGFKLVGRLDAARKAEAKLRRQAESERKTPQPGGPDRKTEPMAEAPKAEEMIQCPACQAYVAAGSTRNCGRADCPY